MHFNATWITYATGDYKSINDKYGNPSPYFRKTFSLGEKLKKATLYATAMGVFKIYVNSQAVADDYLSPGWTDYNQKMPFVTYDITHLLKENNAIGVVLGDGWAVGHVGSNSTFKRTSYSDRIEFAAQIKLEYESGKVELIHTDETWRATKGEILRSDIYMGEYIDHRLDLGDFSSYDYDDSAWDYGKKALLFTRGICLEPVMIPNIVVKHTFKPTLVSQNGKVSLYDVSQNIAGVLRIRLSGTRGSRIVVRHGELIVDGALYTENLRLAEATDTYILSGDGEEVFRPLFTFHGFQFFEITVFGSVEILDITAEAMYTDLEKTGEFKCSDHVVNKVYQNAVWSQRDNFLNVPTDCPQRDERLGWTGDAQIFSQSAMYNMDCDLFYKKYCADMREAQLGNGVIPATAPLPHIGFYSYVGFGPSAGYCEAIAEIPFNHYKTYGDIKIIRDNLPAIKRVLDYYESTSPDHVRRTTGRTYGDWLSVGDAIMDKDALCTLYYARAAYDAWKLGEKINDFEVERYRELYEKVKSAFRKEYMEDDGKIRSDTQSCYVIAYKFGIIDRDEAYTNLKRKFEEDEGKLTCGFLGIRFLLPALCDVGLSDIAYKLITNREYPGWGYSVVNGATTIWEHWDSYTHEKGILPGMNSFNHYSFGSCTEWMYEYCLGIHTTVENPGFSAVTFRPFFPADDCMTFAEGYYDSVKGRISVRWDKIGDEVTYRVSYPEAIKVDFEFNGMRVIDQKTDGVAVVFRLKRV